MSLKRLPRWLAALLLGVLLGSLWSASPSAQSVTNAIVIRSLQAMGLFGGGYTNGQVPTWNTATLKYIPGSSGGVTSVSGTANRIAVTGGAAAVVNIDAAYVGQTSLTTLGTITTGTWNGAVIGPVYGGTGVANNAASTLTISGNFATTLTVTNTTGVTLPTTGTLVNTAVTTLSSLASIGTITTGTWTGTTIAFANGGTGLTTAADDTVMVSSGAAWVAKVVADCTDTGGNHLNYTAATNAFSCGTTSGTPTFTNNLTFTTGNALIQQNTSDGSDSRSITISSGGGAGDSSRAGAIVSYGNENGTLPGGIGIYPGNVAGSAFKMVSSDGMSVWLNILGSTGATTLGGAVTITGHTTFEGVTSTGAIGTGKLVYDTAPTFTTSLTTPLIIANTTTAVIRQNTSDASDSASIALAGGGATGTTRGGVFVVYGNEDGGSNPGGAQMQLGNVTGGNFTVVNGAGSQTFKVNGQDSVTTFYGAATMIANPAAGAGDVYMCISTTNIVHQGAACAASAARFKDHIESIPTTVAWNWLQQLAPSTFQWRAEYGGKQDLGFIADQVAGVDPRFGVYQDGQIFSVNDRAILSTTVAVVQWQQSEIENLTARIAQLENEHVSTHPLGPVQSQPVSARLH